MTITGHFEPEDPRERIERHARTGEPMPLTVVCGDVWRAGSVVVVKTGPDDFSLSPLELLREVAAR